MTTDTPKDQEFVAYLDGELSQEDRARVKLAVANDPRAAARLAALSETTAGMRKAFAPLLHEAPVAKMLASLGDLPTKIEPKPAPAAAETRGAGRRWMIAASLALITLGGLGDHLAFAPGFMDDADNQGHWRKIVASYVRLYTSETFANVPDDAVVQARELLTVGRAMGLRLAPANVALSGMEFKQAQLLRYDGAPLAELNYLDPRYGPLSLCVVRSNAPPAAPQAETLRGLHVSYWNDGHRGFMVIGAQPEAYLAEVARLLGSTLASTPAEQDLNNNGIKL